MKGVIFNLLEHVVSSAHGELLWDRLLEEAGLDGAYTSLGNYADSEIEALVAAAGAALGQPRGEVLRWFGRNAIPLLAERYPGFFDPYASSRSCVLTVNSVIHAEVRKLYTGADCPHFNFRDAADGGLLMDYRSARRMCGLAEGFVEGVADHYGEAVRFEHVHCVERGDAHCTFKVRWSDTPVS